jgi:hypothetical protein
VKCVEQLIGGHDGGPHSISWEDDDGSGETSEGVTEELGADEGEDAKTVL